ncbi:histidine phosphatase superfamily [Triangularia verruculosa]|uniref:Histidine phosphatase superfamily n=1 Tax=Triangularia verruculosa TaxID=2587418 RepID=A0AAN7AXA1_9PEZI|nr:histidine phosphatase superfamily [Triangularia verruculosa]
MDVASYQPGRWRRFYDRWCSLTSLFVLALSAVVIAALLIQLLDQDLISTTNIMHKTLASIGAVVTAILSSLGLTHASHSTNLAHDDSFELDLAWYPPKPSSITNLTAVFNSTGVWGFIFNTSHTPDEQYGTYNWCNMPHVRAKEYPQPPAHYELVYVEVIHRHHLRTPYSSNSFPTEPSPWNCDDIALFSYSSPLTPASPPSKPAYHSPFTSPLNPFLPSPIGLQGTCAFPQITLPGLTDSHHHGHDLLSVYFPLITPSTAQFRVTNNPITSQVAGALLSALLPGTNTNTNPIITPLLIQNKETDSLEPKYPCPFSRELFSAIQSTPEWKLHLSLARELFAQLDEISGVPSTDSGFHVSFDHYFDNLSAKQCHSRPLPCSPTGCITQELADSVYRLGQWEYSYLYRGSQQALNASVAGFGVWIAELLAHVTEVVKGEGGPVKYRHNVAHDGSISRLLGILQADEMHWPGMGAEVVFEVFKLEKRYFIRVLYGGQPLKSSSPMLKGDKNGMIPVEKVIGYLGGLINLRDEDGITRHDVGEMCNAPVAA